VVARHPRIHLLVNNAGLPARADFFGDPDRIEAVARVNYLGSVWCLRAFLPALEAAAPSDVVNVVSVAGTVAVPQSGPYAASKHAQLAFSRSLAVELGQRGVRVHTVNPGFVETEGFPQRARFGRLSSVIVIRPQLVVERLLDAVDRDKSEIVVPRWYRPATWVQTVAPGLVATALGRTSRRRPRSR